jgi:hypothetical protein
MCTHASSVKWMHGTEGAAGDMFSDRATPSEAGVGSMKPV